MIPRRSLQISIRSDLGFVSPPLNKTQFDFLCSVSQILNARRDLVGGKAVRFQRAATNSLLRWSKLWRMIFS